jgi:HSP20 family protein
MTPETFLTPRKNFVNFLATDPFRLLNPRLFEEPFSAFRPFLPREENWPLAAWTPPCDIYETDKEVVLKVELPEVKKENVDVTLDNNVLTLRGERKFEEKTERENYHRVERHYGEFMRSFNLPAFVDHSRIKAEFKDGVLTVTLPKYGEARPKQINVKVN